MIDYTYLSWRKWMPLESLDNERLWNKLKSAPGIYIIRREKPIQRIGGQDNKGIVYIGKSSDLAKRLNDFWNAVHPASATLWEIAPMAKIYLGDQIKVPKDIVDPLSRLLIRVALPIKRNQLDEAERSVFLAYLWHFGELPPLNFSIPGGRWDDQSIEGIAWGEDAISK
jgi:hypothetical protein